jgi:hypothetical protein
MIISDLEHCDRVQRSIQAQINCREVVNGAAVMWAPTLDPREVVRRQAYLDALGSDHLNNGNVLHSDLRNYVRGLAVELALEVRP